MKEEEEFYNLSFCICFVELETLQYMQVQSGGHHNIDHLEERGTEKKSTNKRAN